MATGTVCCHCGCPVDADNAAHYCLKFGHRISSEEALTPELKSSDDDKCPSFRDDVLALERIKPYKTSHTSSAPKSGALID
jgi:hypothetical protein